MIPLNHTTEYLSLPTWAIVEVSGSQAKEFLQGQLTIKMEDITAEHHKLSGYCNLQGRLHGLFYVAKAPMQDEAYWLVMPLSITNHIIKTLKKYAMFSKVTITHLDATHTMLGFINATIDEAAKPGSSLTSISGNKAILQLSSQRALLLGTHQCIKGIQDNQLSEVTMSTQQAWDYLDIKSGLPFIFEDTIECFLPHHLNLGKLGALHFAKGCYLGQEIIARMEYKGKIKKHLHCFFSTTQNSAPNGAEVISALGDKCGTVIQSVVKHNKCFSLICLDDKFLNEELRLNYGDKPSLTVCEQNKAPN